MKKLKIGLVYDLREDYQLADGQPKDFYAEFDFQKTVDTLKRTIFNLGYNVDDIGNIKQLINRLNIGDYNWDLIFNIAEGMYGRSRQAQVPALLEAYGIPFTGSDPLTLALTTDKAMTKRIWISDQLPTVEYCLLEYERNLTSDEKNKLNFPLFVKPAFSGSSAGVTIQSLVHDEESLRETTRAIISQYKQPAIAETFLPGDEYTIGILGNGVEAEVVNAFRQISHSEYGIRSALEKKSYNSPSDFCEPIYDKNIRKQVSQLALRAYHSVQCRDIGRVDIRADSEGKLYLLEINALTNLDIVSSFNYMAELKGISYKKLIGLIITHAHKRYYPGSSQQPAEQEM